MKYQALKRLKTKNKLLKLCDTLAEAQSVIETTGARFLELSYVGQFPLFHDGKHSYSIQGLNEDFGIVVSLAKDDLLAFKNK